MHVYIGKSKWGITLEPWARPLGKKSCTFILQRDSGIMCNRFH